MIRHQPRSTLFPCTTLFRSICKLRHRNVESVLPTHYALHSHANRARVALRSRLTSWNCPSDRSEEHTSELQSPVHLVCRLLLEKKKKKKNKTVADYV